MGKATPALLTALGILLAGCGQPPQDGMPADTPVPAPQPVDAPPAGARSVVNPSGRLTTEQARDLAQLEGREQEVARTVWAPELEAQQRGRTLELAWDALNQTPAPGRLDSLLDFRAEAWVLPRWSEPISLPHGIRRHSPSESGRDRPAGSLRDALGDDLPDSWQLQQVELRHVRYTPGPEGRHGRSEVRFTAHLADASGRWRAALHGPLELEWGPPGPADASTPVRHLDARRLILDVREGPPPFEPVLEERIDTARDTSLVDPLIARDLDGDGHMELLLVGRNLVYRRAGGGPGWKGEALLRRPSGPLVAAVLGDFDGDGQADLLGMKYEALLLFRGSPSGTFDEPGRVAWRATPDVRYVMALTSGDADGDGDPDVFLAQYKVPYENGSMPTPFHDANDGHPAHLLLNDGRGGFSDATAGSGLEAKGRRRTYSASFVDLDADHRLDLVVVSDFAGLDVHQGDGRGHFTDRTPDWIPDPLAFGMGHAFSDFDRDGRLDVLMMGMPSATASRLDHLGLWRTETGAARALRARMTRGSRLYLARPDGRFVETPLSDSLASSGWAWGCAAFDADNDSYPDVVVVNGLESRGSVRDYEGEFWLHDLHVGRSEEDPTAYLYFMSKFNRTRGRGDSYGGWDKNRFYLSRQGEEFLEAGHLFGVGLEADSRNVVFEDFDGDGRGDLAFTSYELWPQARQVLRVYRNTLAGTGHWIGFRFPTVPGPGGSPAGVRVELRTPGHRAVRVLANGDSHRSQHSDTVHFGLGAETRVEEAALQWPNGRRQVLTAPAVDRYHRVEPPPAGPGP